MHVEEHPIAVPAALRPWVSEVSVAAIGARGGQRTIAETPDPATTLALRIVPGEHGDLVVMGPRTRALYHVGKPGPFCVRARIRPGRAGLLLGRPVKGLLNRVVALSDLWVEPGEHLARALAGMGSEPATIGERPLLAPIQQALLSRLPAHRPGGRSRSELAHGASLLLTRDDDPGVRPVPVPAIAARLNVSERHLRNLFTEAVGVSPKHFARLERLRIVLAQAGSTRWARLAAEAGYYDQSHMNAEFRQMMGVTPGAYIAARLPAASPCNPRRPD